jgi:magnesium chelatase family protein
MNLCPCGARGDPAVECSCSPVQLDGYRRRISHALLDRFDLVVALPRPRAAELGAAAGEASELVRARVGPARSLLGPAQAPLAAPAEQLLDHAVERLPLSGRGRARVLRVARTIAACAAADAVAAEHVAEALSYRSPTELERA